MHWQKTSNKASGVEFTAKSPKDGPPSFADKFNNKSKNDKTKKSFTTATKQKRESRKQELMAAHFLASGPIWNLKRNLVLINTQKRAGKKSLV